MCGNIEQNIKDVMKKIADSAISCGRLPSEITLIAATKYANSDQINSAISAGITDIGENRVQQLLEKYDSVLPVTWHFIGRLQSNKVKYIIDKVELIHSVDSLKLAEEIDKQAKKIDKIQNILVQVNFFEEETKGGVKKNELDEMLKTLANMRNIKVCGLMFMPPRHVETKLLEKCNTFFIDICENKYNNMSMEIISFGMSDDFEQAIRFGSTAVRIGSKIFTT